MPDTRTNIEHDEIIKDKLRVLKRSGLALPFEVWPEFVVDTVVNYAQWCQALPASESYHHTGKIQRLTAAQPGRGHLCDAFTP